MIRPRPRPKAPGLKASGLHLVTPAPPSRRAKAPAKPKPKLMLSCPCCDGRELTLARIGVLLDPATGRASGGTPVYLCTLCLMQGRRVVVR